MMIGHISIKHTPFQTLVTQQKPTEFEKDKRTVALALISLPTKVTVREEYYVNDVNGLLGNVGGMVGVLLGASILTLADYVMELMRKSTKEVFRGTKKVINLGRVGGQEGSHSGSDKPPHQCDCPRGVLRERRQ